SLGAGVGLLRGGGVGGGGVMGGSSGTGKLAMVGSGSGADGSSRAMGAPAPRGIAYAGAL
ncbi:MAG: hypothetical protein M3O31_07375, partial [Acidobacteriota bacterium]|nr:hypothetical protein [Acidobacteriota bacterium]